mgnify:CR=1 FL=1
MPERHHTRAVSGGKGITMFEIIRVENLSYIYNLGMPDATKALDDVSFTVEEGDFVGIIGSTGSGKSTLISHFNGLNRPTSGRVLVDGKDLWEQGADLRSFRFLVGLVMQYPEYQLFEETCAKDIAYGPRNMGLDEAEIQRRVKEAAAFVGLSDELLEKSPFELSGGQKRRVAIAGVMAMHPRVLVLDEPAAGLDPEGRDTILSQIKDYHKKTGITVLLVSHSMEDIAKYANRVLVMHRAKIAMYDTVENVFARAQELLELGLSVPQVTQIFLKLRQMGLDIPADVYTIPYAVKTIQKALAAKQAGEVQYMLKDITIGQHFPGHSVLHRCDPRLKLVATIAYIVVLFVAPNPLGLTLSIALLAALYKIAQIPGKMILKSLKPIVPIVIFTAVLNLFFVTGQGEPLVHVWILNIYIEGVKYAILLAVRVCALIAGTSLLTYTTSPIVLTDAIESLLRPLAKLHFPVHELAMMMTIALRFIPTLIEETEKIMNAQKARGAMLDSGTFTQRIKALVPILIPLFISAFRRADELAMAMECRCYHGGEGRTRLKQLKFTSEDFRCLVVITVALVVIACTRLFVPGLA